MKSFDQYPTWLCVKQISQITGYGLATAYQHAKDGYLPPPQRIVAKKRLWHRDVIQALEENNLEQQEDGSWIFVDTGRRIPVAPGWQQAPRTETFAHKPACAAVA